MLKTLLHKNYLIYGGSILFSRGLEYAVLFFAAHYLTKNDYGELEFYKKLIEVVSSVLAFGFPILLLSYTRSRESKLYFYILSILFVIGLSTISIFIGLFYADWLILLPALIFFALFFTGGIAQSYQLVQNGSNYASIYKMAVAFLFYTAMFVLIYFYNVKGKAFIYPSYLLLPIAILFSYVTISATKINFGKVRRYWKLFRGLLSSSFTLVISNFSSMMFLYIDILVIKLISLSPNAEIAEFSFGLNVASILLIVANTLVQVDIEKLKNQRGYLNILNKKILTLTLSLALFLLIGYYLLINSGYFDSYKYTFVLFMFILTGKIFATFSNLFGTNLAILKKFKVNLYINLSVLMLNLIVCVVVYRLFGLLGIAISGAVILAIRYFIFRFFSKKYYSSANFKAL